MAGLAAMSHRVAVTSFAVWSSAGASVNARPAAPPSGGLLAPWPEAPALSVVHPNARRPPRQAAVLVQLVHALLEARSAEGPPAAKTWADTDLLLGTAKGSEGPDLDFLRSIQERGSGFGSPSTFVYTLATAAPAEVALALGLRRSLATLTAGTISGLTAIVSAAKHVGQGRSQACITGGMELSGQLRHLGLADAEGELAALFLLEPSTSSGRWPHITGAQFGFDAASPEGARKPPDSATSTMLALASACAEPRGSKPCEIAGRSPEGHWARFCLQW
jgi:hypothetical protein